MESAHGLWHRHLMMNDDNDEDAGGSDRDLERFEAQPDKTKELERLKDLVEKSVGPEKADLDQEIRRRSDTEN